MGGRKNPVIPEKIHYRRTPFIFISLILSGALGLLCLFSTVEEIPITKRKRRYLLPRSWEMALGDQLSEETIKLFENSVVDKNHPLSKYIETIGNHICAQNNLEQYRFFLVESPDCNAISIPGKTIIVFTGILPIMENQSGCAMVLAHELSHLLAHHSIDMLLLTAPIVWLCNKLVGNLGSRLVHFMVTLPQSRENEFEADRIGLHLMARACFDINEAPKVMQRLDSSEANFEWLQTHPTGKRRRERLDKEKELEEIAKITNSCPKIALFRQRNDYLSKFNYNQILPKMSTDRLHALMKDKRT